MYTKTNFITDIIEQDIKDDKYAAKVHTRFPPEPNGFLHIGHAKSICLNFGAADRYKGLCNLRFDDTNPTKESTEYVDSIKQDVQWLGFDWQDRLFFASDYFGQLYEFARELIKKAKAYVCELTPDQIRDYRGTITEPGRESPYRNRSPEENLDLFARMKAGEFEEGTKVLRAKIDMSSPHLIMRDPPIFRIRKKEHYRTGRDWCIYPMYDFAHCLSDAIEEITHSLCTLEFENNRPLYDWFLDQLDTHHPKQIEFARLNLSHTVLSKRKLHRLVEEKHVSGWDDPRMPTIAGLRRRGVTPEAIRNFCSQIGVAKFNSIVDMVVLENTVRQDLNKQAPRFMGVLNPLKVVITNYPEGKTEDLEAVNNPEDESMGSRKVPFSKCLYIEREDFSEDPPKKFYRLAPGREVRLRYAYFIKCVKVIKDERTGKIEEVHCTYDPQTRGGNAPDARKVKATLHWVCANKAIDVQARLYDRLFAKRNPGEVDPGKDFTDNLNPESLQIIDSCKAEPGVRNIKVGEKVQFERIGYFCKDKISAESQKPVFNRIVSLRDKWAKISNKQ